MTLDELLDRLDVGESQDIEFKSAEGGFPLSAWETFSAFANTAGGFLVLGVRERSGKFEIGGVKNPNAQTKIFWDGHNNPQRLSSPICGETDVSVVGIAGRKLLLVHVPAASRTQRPVFIGGNPLTGTYKRNYEGDYRCTESEVRQMFRDAGETPQDGQILDHFGLDDLDADTLKTFRNRFSSREPDHPFLAEDDQGLLVQLGGWRRERATGAEGLTLAGLLMFGKERSLIDCLPRFHLDYQEKQTDDPEERWSFRLTLDGRWQPNLFNFYYRVYPRLVDGLNVPFQLDKDSVRIGETHVHQALREALVNSLIHADYQGSQGITIIKRPDAYLFRNPGRLRIPIDRLYEGGVSDPRNPNLQKMFQMLGLGEKSGSGFPKVLRAWREQHWFIPLVSEALDLEMTTLTLPLASLVPEEVESELREIVGGAYRTLPELDRIILLLAHRFAQISNMDIQPYCREHPRDIGIRLKCIVDQGWLQKSGHGRGTSYRLAGRGIPGQLSFLDETASRADVEHKAANSEQYTLDSEQYEHDSEQYKKLLAIAEPVRKKGRADSTLVKNTILRLCSGRFLSLRTLAELLGREPDSVRNHYVNQMLKEGLLRLRHPGHPNHPQQAYCSDESALVNSSSNPQEKS